MQALHWDSFLACQLRAQRSAGTGLPQNELTLKGSSGPNYVPNKAAFQHYFQHYKRYASHADLNPTCASSRVSLETPFGLEIQEGNRTFVHYG